MQAEWHQADGSQKSMRGGVGVGGGERERESSKTLFYKDCSLDSVKNPSNN